MVHGIVIDHAGAISVVSTLGEGATFEVIVPVYLGDEIPIVPAGEQSEPTERRGRVLFVDDEVHLVKMAQKVLGRLGYSVVGETNGHDALDRFRAVPAGFDLIVTD